MADVVEAFELPDPIGHPLFGEGRMTWLQASACAGPRDVERYEDGRDNEAGVGHGDDRAAVKPAGEPVKGGPYAGDERGPVLAIRREGAAWLGNQVERAVAGAVCLPGQAIGLTRSYLAQTLVLLHRQTGEGGGQRIGSLAGAQHRAGQQSVTGTGPAAGHAGISGC